MIYTNFQIYAIIFRVEMLNNLRTSVKERMKQWSEVTYSPQTGQKFLFLSSVPELLGQTSQPK